MLKDTAMTMLCSRVGQGIRILTRAFHIVPAIVFGLLAPMTAVAENSLSVYGGLQSASPGNVSGVDDLGAPFDFGADWLGKSLAMPPYYGIRATHWPADSDWGFAIEFTHTKVYASDATRANSGFEILEFTDGLNILTLNAIRRFDELGPLRPYAGAGFGLSLPHVEVQTRVGGPVTFEYQIGGPAARAIVGVEYDLNENWSVFSEINATYSTNEVTLNGGGTLSTNVFTQALNLGASFRF